MPKKSKTKKISARHEMIDEKTENLFSSDTSFDMPKAEGSKMKGVIGVVVLLVVLGVYLGSRGYIVAAMVNGKPIFRWDVTRALVSRYGSQTLESMISERLIADAAQKSGVTLTQAEVDTKANDLVKSLGPNVKLEDLLKYQGMTKADFDQQIRLQLTVEKMLGKDIAVEDKDVDDYIAKNRETMTATDEAALRVEAKETLSSQKISEKIQPWFAELKAKASITKLMK